MVPKDQQLKKKATFHESLILKSKTQITRTKTFVPKSYSQIMRAFTVRYSNLIPSPPNKVESEEKQAQQHKEENLIDEIDEEEENKIEE